MNNKYTIFSQSERAKYYMSPFIQHSGKGKIIKAVKRSMDAMGSKKRAE